MNLGTACVSVDSPLGNQLQISKPWKFLVQNETSPPNSQVDFAKLNKQSLQNIKEFHANNELLHGVFICCQPCDNQLQASKPREFLVPIEIEPPNSQVDFTKLDKRYQQFIKGFHANNNFCMVRLSVAGP